MKRSYGLVATLLFAMLALTARADGTKLTGADISTTIFGNTMVGHAPSGTSFKIYVDKQGKTHISGISSRGSFDDHGIYVIEGDLMCATWNRIRNGRKICLSVSRAGSTFNAYDPDGSLNSTFEVKPGNPENL